MSGDFSFANASLFDLFRMEVETHVPALSEALLALEGGATEPAYLQNAMRAAHSIKGAARVVGVEIAVRLAHAVEDCLVAAQEGKRTLGRGDFDLLLAATDRLREIGELSVDGVKEWEGRHAETVDQLGSSLRAGSPTVAARPAEEMLRAAPSQAPIAAEPAPPPPAQTSESESTNGDRVVRVTADNLERLMGLAGEILVEARRFRPFADTLLALKGDQARLAGIVGRLAAIGDWNKDAADVRELLTEAQGLLDGSRRAVARRLEAFDQLATRAEDVSERLYRESIASRMRPLGDGLVGFPRMVRDLARSLDKEARLEIVGADTLCDRDVLDKLEAPLNHLLRNAVDHGLESPEERRRVGKNPVGVVRVDAGHVAGQLVVAVSDDGRGIDLERIRAKVIQRGLHTAEMAESLTPAELMEFLFLPGFTTRESVTMVSGRGVGLDAVRSMVQEARGIARAFSNPGQGMRVVLQLPTTLSVVRATMVTIAGESYAFPVTSIERIVTVPTTDARLLEDRPHFLWNGASIGLIWAHQVLALEEKPDVTDPLRVVVIRDHETRYGVLVDRFEGETSLVVRPLDPRLGKVPNILAAAILEDGLPTLIIDVEDMVRSVDKLLGVSRPLGVKRRADLAPAVARKRILVVDDSITVREVQRRLLENNGYEVEVAVDGMEGWNVARERSFDLIISDVDMPRMNGIELVTALKGDERLRGVPVMIVSYKDREEDRMRGLNAGADYYLTKSSFHDNTLVEKVVDLIGEAVS